MAPRPSYHPARKLDGMVRFFRTFAVNRLTKTVGTGVRSVRFRAVHLAWKEWLFLLVVLSVMLAPFTIWPETHHLSPAIVSFTVLAWLPLFVRTRYPLTVLVLVVGVEILGLLLIPRVAADPVIDGVSHAIPATKYTLLTATAVAIWTVASRSPRAVGWTTAAVAAVWLTVTLTARPIAPLTDGLLLVNVLMCTAAAGVIVASRRNRAERLLQERRDETHQQILAERLRIARELHDVLAHHLTLVNTQAAVAEYLLPTDVAAATAALRDINRHTFQAVQELQATVGLLRQDHGPAADTRSTTGIPAPVPGMPHLEQLLDGFRTAGVDLLFDVIGEPVPLSTAGDLAAYRIIQEALTNSLKHAAGERAVLTLIWSPQELRITVRNAASRRRSVFADTGGGNGVIGMRERAYSCGGSLLAERTADEGFTVSAIIPSAINRDSTEITDPELVAQRQDLL